MKTVLKISIGMNLLLAVGLLFAFAVLRRDKSAPVPTSADKAAVPAAHSALPTASEIAAAPFRWQQLDSGNDYRLFVTNLRSIGCPENTIDDIVRGNVGRAFAWERARLKIDGSGNGLWSSASEVQLLNSLLGKTVPAEAVVSSQEINNPTEQKVAAQTASIEPNVGSMLQPGGDSEEAKISGQAQGGQAAALPLLVQNGGWNGQSAVSSSPQQSQNGINGGSQNANNPAYDPANSGPNDASNPNPSPSASSAPSTPSGPPDPLGPDDPYALSSEDNMNKNLQDYFSWYKPQVTATPSGESVGINPTAAPGQ